MKRKINAPKQRPAPLIPDGAEVWIGLIFAVLTYLFTKSIYEPWFYIALMTLVYAFCIYMVNIITDDYRMWARGMKKRNTVLQHLDTIATELENLRFIDDDVIKQLQKRINISFNEVAAILQFCVDTSYEAINALDDQRSGVQYTGYSDLQTKAGQLRPTVVELVDILQHPSKAGGKLDEKIIEFVKGIDGYAEWIPGLSARANSGDLFNATTNAILLGSLRNLLKKDE
jgi:hypothetical protein